MRSERRDREGASAARCQSSSLGIQRGARRSLSRLRAARSAKVRSRTLAEPVPDAVRAGATRRRPMARRRPARLAQGWTRAAGAASAGRRRSSRTRRPRRGRAQVARASGSATCNALAARAATAAPPTRAAAGRIIWGPCTAAAPSPGGLPLRPERTPRRSLKTLPTASFGTGYGGMWRSRQFCCGDFRRRVPLRSQLCNSFCRGRVPDRRQAEHWTGNRRVLRTKCRAAGRPSSSSARRCPAGPINWRRRPRA